MRKLIAHSGVSTFKVRELRKRTQLALRTVYAASDSKENLISRIINRQFKKAMEEDGPIAVPDTLEAVSARLDLLAKVVIGQRQYSSVMAPIYFSATIDHRIYEVLREIALSHIRPWIKILAAEKKLGVSSPAQVEFLLSQLANTEYAVINDWRNGRLGDAQLGTYLKLAAFYLVAGCVQHKAVPELTAAINSLRRSAVLDGP